LTEIWVYLAASPLLWLTLTLVAYQLGEALFRLAGNQPLANPVLLAILVIAGILTLTHTDYATYFAGAQFVHFLLGPATVALAIPLYRNVRSLRRSLWAILAALVVGSLTAAATAIGLGWLFGASWPILMSLAPKSATTPIAMGVAERLGGLPSLTAVVVILTGVVGAAFGPWLLDRLQVRDPKARGIAIGVAAHGLGTARLLALDEVAGAFASLAMGLNGAATAILVPLLVSLL